MSNSLRARNDKIYGVKVDALPPKFIEKIKQYDLATEGYWTTYALNEDEARDAICSMVKLITKEKMNDDFCLTIINKPKIKYNSSDFAGNYRGNADRTLRGLMAKRENETDTETN